MGWFSMLGPNSIYSMGQISGETRNLASIEFTGWVWNWKKVVQNSEIWLRDTFIMHNIVLTYKLQMKWKSVN